MLRVGRLAAGVGLAAVLTAAGCGRGTPPLVPLKQVPMGMVPAELPSTDGGPALTLEEYKAGAQRIASAGDRSVVADGRVWEIRRGTTLVAALQISTLKPRVDVSSAKERDNLASLVVSGAVQRIRASGVEVITARTSDKVVYLWFGNQLFEVLQIKGAGVDPERMLASILEFQKPSGQLRIASRSRG